MPRRFKILTREEVEQLLQGRRSKGEPSDLTRKRMLGLDLSGLDFTSAFLDESGFSAKIDELLFVFRTWFSNPIEFYSCFISYSSKDQDFAERLHVDLQNNGVRCWFAPEDLKI